MYINVIDIVSVNDVMFYIKAMPTMGGNSTIKLVLDKVLKSSSTNKMPVRLTESSLEIGNVCILNIIVHVY